MKIQDFEKAMPYGMEIQEIKIRHSQVTACICKAGSQDVVFNSLGQAFKYEADQFVTERLPEFDLKFE